MHRHTHRIIYPFSRLIRGLFIIDIDYGYDRGRTCDMQIKSLPLYQLSYISMTPLEGFEPTSQRLKGAYSPVEL